MSDSPQGPGWWLASDGKYYPPQPAPVAPPGQPEPAQYAPPQPQQPAYAPTTAIPPPGAPTPAQGYPMMQPGMAPPMGAPMGAPPMGMAPLVEQNKGGSGKIILLILLAVLVIGGGVAAALILANQGSSTTSKPVVALDRCAVANGKPVLEGKVTNTGTSNASFSVSAEFLNGTTAVAKGSASLADVKPAEARSVSITGDAAAPDGFKCRVDVKST